MTWADKPIAFRSQPPDTTCKLVGTFTSYESRATVRITLITETPCTVAEAHKFEKVFGISSDRDIDSDAVYAKYGTKFEQLFEKLGKQDYATAIK